MINLLTRHRSVPPSLSPQLDTFRGLSAIAVLVSHASQTFVLPLDRRLHILFGLLAQASVMVFFVLSGFLICKSITRIIRDRGEFDAASYGIDRFNRIIPPFLFAMLIALALWALSPQVFPGGTRSFGAVPAFAARRAFELDLPSFLGTLFFANGFATSTISINGPLWSLSFEVWYYIAAGLAASFGRRGPIAAALLMIALGSVNRMFLGLSVVWFAGAALTIAHNHDVRCERLAKYLGGLALAAAMVFAAAHIHDFLTVDSLGRLNGRWVLGFSVTVGIFFACLLHQIVNGTVAIRPIAPSTAKFSYTLYIIHFPLLLFLYGLTHRHATSLATALLFAIGGALLCLLIAQFAARWVENLRPLQRAEHIAQTRARSG